MCGTYACAHKEWRDTVSASSTHRTTEPPSNNAPTYLSNHPQIMHPRTHPTTQPGTLKQYTYAPTHPLTRDNASTPPSTYPRTHQCPQPPTHTHLQTYLPNTCAHAPIPPPLHTTPQHPYPWVLRRWLRGRPRPPCRRRCRLPHPHPRPG